MNILFTSHRYHPDIGGIEGISDLLARSFVAAGHAVRLVTQSPGSVGEDRALFPFPVFRQLSSRELLAAYRWADVVFQNNLEVRQLWPSLLIRKPVVIGLQTWIRDVNSERGAIQRFKQWSLSRASTVIACSEAIRVDSCQRAVVIGNPYRSQLFRLLPELERQRSIVFLGRLVSDKGVDLLLRAFAALHRPHWRLSVVGDGPERQVLQALSQELQLGNSVSFLGAMQGEQLVRLLNQHELMAVPSRWREPFGVVALEGLACGCVVLASDGGGLPDALGPAGLLFKRGDEVDLTRKLAQLMDDASMRTKLRARTSAHLEAFQQQAVCDRYLEVLEEAYTAN